MRRDGGRWTCYFCAALRNPPDSLAVLVAVALLLAKNETRCSSTGDSPKYDSSMWSLVSQSRREIKRSISQERGERRGEKGEGWEPGSKAEKRREEKTRGMPRMLSLSTLSCFIVSESVSPRSSYSLLVRSTHSLPVFPLYLSLRTYSVFPSPRPIYLPPRVAEWILFVSHRYFCEPACRSPSKTVSPPRFMFPPTQRRIDPFLLSDVYVYGGASPTPPRPHSPPFPAACSRAREHRDLPHTTDYSRSSRSRRPPCPQVPSLRLLSRLLFSGSVTLPFPRPRFLPLTALYRLVTSVSRARDLRASALGRTIEHYDFLVPGSFYIETSVMDKFTSLFLFTSFSPLKRRMTIDL